MLTQTAHAHLAKAVREALRVNHRHACTILMTIRNDVALCQLEGRDLRGMKLCVSGSTAGGRAHGDVYLDTGRGYDSTGIRLWFEDADMARWDRLPFEECYAIAADIHANRCQALIDLDDRMAAEAAAEALEAANDDDLLDLDAVMGPVPESRDWNWMDGTVVRADVASSGDHVVALVELADGERRTMGMLPLFSGVQDSLAHVSERIGVPSRLCVGRINAFDRGVDVPEGFDRSMPVLDMIIPQRDVPALGRTLRRAA